MTQMDFVMKQLTKNKRISRNQCLKRYISRLGARISDLKKEGWNIQGEYEKTKWGQDYVYRLER
jgi:hypothetical protein